MRTAMLERHRSKYQYAHIKGRAEQLKEAGQQLPSMDEQVLPA